MNKPWAFGLLLLFAAASLPLGNAQSASGAESQRWASRAARVQITRDDWGIAHVHGKSDADAVFGMIYAQCEDDFNRVEMNYLTALGRVAELEGETAIWADLRQRLFIDPNALKTEYLGSPAWLKTLMEAWADGANFYLDTHKLVKPHVLARFEPWMALAFTEGSIGGDIEKIDLRELQHLYDAPARPAQARNQQKEVERAAPAGDAEEAEPGGSNGFAISPKLTKAGHALLLINPHTSFFFRSELQMTSDEGLNAYGAVTWGQFFVYQGFNERAGWMHTSSNVDAVDEFVEQIKSEGGPSIYRYGSEERPVATRTITLRSRSATGFAERTFQVMATGHGPVVRRDGQGALVSVELMQEHVKALEQSWLRTRAHTYAEYSKTMELMANSSNNTVYADADGTIAYWHGDFIPRRNSRFDYTRPVDGSDPATDWHGLLSLSEVPQLKNPASGWLFNVNDSPWNGAGASSLKQADFPAYVEQGLETARGLHAMQVLANGREWTPETLRKAAYDSYLPWFARTLPTLVAAWRVLPEAYPRRAKLRGQIELLRAWDCRWSADSLATSLAVFWGTEMLKTAAAPARTARLPSEYWVAGHVSADALLTALDTASERLTTDFGSWKTPWGQINRFQRLTGDIVQPFSDAAPSLPVPFTASLWGSLASFAAKPYPGTKKWYGTSGNSFVAIVEFGSRIRAVAVTAGGESGHANSPNFNDEAGRYASGDLREVYFYPDQLKGHTKKVYRPGDVTH